MNRNKIVPIILILTVILGFDFIAQAGELIKPRLDATFLKLTDGTKSVTLSMSARIDDKRVKIKDASIKVFALNESGKTELGTVVTDYKGIAVLKINPDVSLPKDHEGYYTFEAQFPGNQKLDIASASVHVKDVFLSMSFDTKDSTKNVIVKVSSINEKGETIKVGSVPVEFYIKRLFCMYRFGGEKTDSTGTCVAEFPKNMPGDTAGMVLVIAKILENETYGTVETSQSFTGGTPLMIEPKPKRGLGDTDAPLWMVYTLIVLLSGVWLHVIYVISLVIRINIIGKKALKKSTA